MPSYNHTRGDSLLTPCPQCRCNAPCPVDSLYCTRPLGHTFGHQYRNEDGQLEAGWGNPGGPAACLVNMGGFTCTRASGHDGTHRDETLDGRIRTTWDQRAFAIGPWLQMTYENKGYTSDSDQAADAELVKFTQRRVGKLLHELPAGYVMGILQVGPMLSLELWHKGARIEVIAGLGAEALERTWQS